MSNSDTVTLQYESLIGLQYVPGLEHCWKLVRLFYAENYGIELRDYPFPKDWNSDQLDLIGMLYEREGFFKLEDWDIKSIQPGDLMCIAVGRQNANHFVINLGGNMLLHHPLMQISRVEPLRSFWRSQTCYVLRHKNVANNTAALPNISIKELADARYHVAT